MALDAFRAPSNWMQGAATQTMPQRIVEEVQQRRQMLAAETLRAAAMCGATLRCSALKYRKGYDFDLPP